MKTITSSHWPDVLQAFRVHSHGRIQVLKATQSFGFQIRARDTVPHPALIFGLAQVYSPGQLARFTVRFDLESGEVWDAANDGGLLGHIATANWPSPDEEHPLVLRWEIERKGSALIPRLHIGDEEILYPSQLFPDEAPFVAFTGHDLDEIDHRAIFAPGYVWCQDRIG
jgi:hypothetical protein